MRRKRVHEILSRIDPSRMRSGCPMGLRDGAVLALLLAGLTPEEVTRLLASAVTLDRGKLWVTMQREENTWCVALTADQAGRVWTWLKERRLWSESVPVFSGRRGALSAASIYTILKRYRYRYRRPRRERRC